MEAPISASLGAIGSLIRKLDLLLESSEEVNGCRPRSHKGAKYGMHLLRDDLEAISSYLQDLSELEDPPLIAKCWMKEARELSYDIEDYIDRFVFSGHVASIKTRCRRISHMKIARLVETNKKLIRRKRVAAMISDFRIYTQEAIERHKRYELDCSNFRRRFEPAGRLPTTYEEEADIIIHCGMTKFMDSLDNDRDEQLKVVSVVGSGGIGKTTFVTVLYKKLKGHFDCGAFVRLTRKPDIKTMLRDILTQVRRQQPHHDHGEDPDLIGKIREHLQHKRYLIIIDDLWSASIWDVISHAFPGGGMCSRIIATTQIEDVALACCCYHSDYVFEMRPLDDDLSRKLFFNSLFCSESDFPHKVKEVSNKIIKICGGSPLATTIIARLLASHPVMLMEQWTYIYDSLSFNLRTCSTSEGLLKLIVNFSYNNLTHHLKTCLLYLSMYPDGCMVCKDDLVKQWVAEGFINATGGREVGIAESYFHELIARRFLQPADIRYNSEVVSCSVHDVVRDLVVQKSLEENFIMVLDCYRRNVSLSEKVHRLSLHFPHAKYARTNIRSSQVRSLAYFGLSKCMPSIREFKLIRVLNLGLSGHEDGDDTIDLTGISELLQLRYLKVASDVCIELPKHMRRLHYLETLDIGTKITHVPWDIIHLPCLLHLHLPFETNLMDWISAIPASVWSHGKLTNLQYLHLTCSIPVPDHLQRNMEVLGSLLGGHGNLKTLALILGSAHKNVVHSPSEVTFSWDEFAPPLLERFEWLPHIFTFSRVPKWMGKLGNLRILKISVRELLRDGVNILRELSALTALSLYLQMAPVKRIVFDKAGFSALKYFKLICSAVPCLKFEMDTMPNLKRLKLGFSAHRVDQHGTTPISIEHLPGLEEISAKVGNATSSDAETALTAAVSNHPRNPRIRVQLVDWNFCGDGVSYMISKQKEPRTLEDEILEEGLHKILDHIWSKKRKILDGKKKEDYVRHGGVKRHRKENCTKNVKSRDVLTSPYILGEQSITIEGKASASSSGISSRSTMFSCISEATSPQQRNSKIEKCQFEGCMRKARGSLRRCIAHGGGRRCQKLGCQKGAEGKTIFCKAHGGGRRCEYLGCTKSAEGRTDFCIAHGGGRRCSHEAETAPRPSYPSSKSKKDWDKLEAEVKKEEKDEKLDGDAALNKWLHDLCLSGDEKLDGDAALNKFSRSRRRPEGDAMAASDLESEARAAFYDDAFKRAAELYTQAIDYYTRTPSLRLVVSSLSPSATQPPQVGGGAMAASDLESKAKEAFFDDDFELAAELYTQAIDAGPATADLYADRAQAHIKLGNYTEAVADANKAIELDPTMHKAYYRKGAACMKLEEYQTAKAALELGSSYASGDSRFTRMLKECEERIAEEANQAPVKKVEAPVAATVEDREDVANMENTQPVVEPPSKPKYRHDFYNSSTEVVLTIFAKGVPADCVVVDFGEQMLSVSIEVPGEEPYHFQPRLFSKIIPEKCKYLVLSTKVEIRLAKAEQVTWTTLDYSGRPKALPQKISTPAETAPRPSYPSLKSKKLWDKVEAEVKKEEKDEKLDGDAALNKFFRDIYKDADEDMRRAMMKSFVEQNGTVLSTNWKDVGSKKVEGSPPDGMELKKWEY